MKIFDTHAHYDDNIYDVDREEVFKKIYSEGVTDIALIGASLVDSKKEKELAKIYNRIEGVPKFYYVIGDHPDEIPKYSPDIEDGVEYLKQIENLVYGENGKIEAIAIGEIGLDYYGDFKNEDDYKRQKEWFIAELDLARKLDLPIVIHSRDACKDTLDTVKTFAKGLTGIVHCFSYEKEIALEYVRLGFCIGVGGVVTFKNGRKLKDVVEAVPIENIVAETDAPWLAPMPYRGKRNESSYIKYVIEEISRIKNVDVDTTAEVLYNNALEIYGL